MGGEKNNFLVNDSLYQVLKEDLIEKMDFSLAIELSDADLALSLLPINDEGLLHILENILKKGMPNVAKKILFPGECESNDNLTQ